MSTKRPSRRCRGRASVARKDRLFRRLEEATSRAELVEALCLSENLRAAAVADRMLDPAYRHHSFAKLCERAGLGYRDVLDIFRRHKIDVGMLNVLNQLPDILEGLANDARSQSLPCDRCGGTGKLTPDQNLTMHMSCPPCAGSGRVRKPGDPAARRLIFRILGLIRPGRAIVQQQINIGRVQTLAEVTSVTAPLIPTGSSR